MYNKEIKILPSLKNGYYQFRDKYHPLAYSSDNSVYLHRHLTSLKLGMWLTSEQVVHHKDGNKLNNSLDNLEIMSNEEHSKLHNTTGSIAYFCDFCGSEFTRTNKYSKYCCVLCYRKDSVKEKAITKELLEELIPLYSWRDLGKIFHYSDNGIKKRAMALGCNLSLAKYRHKNSTIY